MFQRSGISNIYNCDSCSLCLAIMTRVLQTVDSTCNSVLCVCAEEWSEAVKPSSSVHSQSTSNTNWSFSSPQLPAIFDSAPIIFDNLQTSELCNSQKIVCKIWMVDVVYFYRKTIIIITGVIFYEYYVGLKISILLSATFSGPPLLQLVSVCSINSTSKNIH